jgi:hypothetical protein
MSAVQALPFDQTLPQLQVALDPLMMQLIFQNLLVTDNAAIHVDSCIVERVKYKAGEKCVISYLLHLYDGANDCCHEQRLAARLFPAGLSAARYQKAQREPVTPPRYGKAVTHLPELGMVLWAFPNDRKIATLPHLMVTARQENDHRAETMGGNVPHRSAPPPVGALRTGTHLYGLCRTTSRTAACPPRRLVNDPDLLR